MSTLAALPATWTWATLGDVLSDIETGKSFKCDERPPGANEIGVVKVSSVTWGTFAEEESKTCQDPHRVEERLFVKPGDLLFSRANTIQLVGAAVLVGSVSKKLMLSDKILRFRLLQVDPRWVLYALRTPIGRQEIERLATGNQESMRNIGQERIRQIRIPLAPMPEQERIVAEIDKQFTRLDAGVEALKRLQIHLKRYRASVLKAACEGRLVPTEAELARREGRDYEPAATHLGRFDLPLEPQRKRAGRLWGAGVIPELSENERTSLPEGWCWVKVGLLGRSLEDAVQVGPMSMKSSEFDSSGVPVLNVGCVRWGSFDESKADHLPPQKAAQFGRYRIETGDVLFTRSGTVGRCAVAQDRHAGWLMTFHLLRVRPDPRKCLPEFLRLALEGAPHISRQTREASVGTTRAGFNTHLLAGLDIPVPPLPEQKRIVTAVEQHISTITHSDEVIRGNLARSGRLRQSILKRAFEGRLVAQNPGDEPASVLLDRIRASKETPPPASTDRPRPAKSKSAVAV